MCTINDAWHAIVSDEISRMSRVSCTLYNDIDRSKALTRGVLNSVASEMHAADTEELWTWKYLELVYIANRFHHLLCVVSANYYQLIRRLASKVRICDISQEDADTVYRTLFKVQMRWVRWLHAYLRCICAGCDGYTNI